MKIKIDFGRVFPGIVLFLVGLVLLVVLALVALVAFLFSFLAGSGAVLEAILELAIVPALLIAAGIVTILTGISWWGGGGGWLSGVARAKALEDHMRISSRVGEVVGAIISLIVFFFLYENQLRGVAFFTPSFGSQASIYFYGPLFTGIILSLARAVLGYRNKVRPFDAMNALFLVVAALWLLAVFPFDFAHFGDMFPSPIQFLFGWLSNPIGRFLFILGAIGSSINFVYTTALYTSLRHHTHVMRTPTESPPSPAA